MEELATYSNQKTAARRDIEAHQTDLLRRRFGLFLIGQAPVMFEELLSETVVAREILLSGADRAAEPCTHN